MENIVTGCNVLTIFDFWEQPKAGCSFIEWMQVFLWYNYLTPIMSISDQNNSSTPHRLKLLNKSTNEGTKEPTNKPTRQQTNKRTNERTNEQTNKQTNKQTNTTPLKKKCFLLSQRYIYWTNHLIIFYFTKKLFRQNMSIQWPNSIHVWYILPT